MVVLLVCATAGLIWLNVEVNRASDQVVINQEEFWGDATVVEGLTVEIRSEMEGMLFWDTQYSLGAEPQTSTEYVFYNSKRTQEPPVDYIGLRLETAIHYGLDLTAESGIGTAYNELYESLQPGEEASMMLWMKDYYDYYPITAAFHVPGSNRRGSSYYPEGDPEPGTYEYLLAKLNEYFKIPMMEEECVEISISRSTSGSTTSMGWGSSNKSEDTYYVGSDSVYTDEAIYFTLHCRTQNGNIVDLSQLREGYGIYRIPRVEVDQKENPKYIGVDADRIEMVYELDPEWEIMWFELDPLDESHLRMMTCQGNQYVFTLIDLDTMETLQKFTMVEREKDGWWFIQDEGDFIVLCLREEMAVVLQRDDAGLFAVDMTAPLSRDSVLSDWYDIDKLDMDYKDGRLAVVDTLRDESWYSFETCGVQVLVVDETGEIFYGAYSSSLTKGEQTSNYYDCARTLDYMPLTIRWE